MAEVKFAKGSEEWQMFMDFWALCQKYWEPEETDECLNDPPKMVHRSTVMPGTPFVFRPFPLVKGLINDEEAKSIAELIKLRHMWIMTHADGVTAHFL